MNFLHQLRQKLDRARKPAHILTIMQRQSSSNNSLAKKKTHGTKRQSPRPVDEVIQHNHKLFRSGLFYLLILIKGILLISVIGLLVWWFSPKKQPSNLPVSI